MARLERGDLTYIINDHLGTPKEVVGWEGHLRWSVDHDSWGTLRTKRGATATQVERGDYWIEATSIAGNTERAYAPEPDHFYCPIRFQGQWEDAETGLYYNRYRYYCPYAILYASADPIGLMGGPSNYSYVSNPVYLIDPWGLETLYRNLRAGQDPCADGGLFPSAWGDPSRDRITPTGHVLNGSRDGFTSPYISTTRSLDVIDEWRQPGQRT